MTVRSVPALLRGRGCVYADICVYEPDAAYTPGREANVMQPVPGRGCDFSTVVFPAYEPAGWDVDDSDFLVIDGDT